MSKENQQKKRAAPVSLSLQFNSKTDVAVEFLNCILFFKSGIEFELGSLLLPKEDVTTMEGALGKKFLERFFSLVCGAILDDTPRYNLQLCCSISFETRISCENHPGLTLFTKSAINSFLLIYSLPFGT